MVPVDATEQPGHRAWITAPVPESVSGVVALWILAITWLFAALGLAAGSAEAANGYGFVLLFGTDLGTSGWWAISRCVLIGGAAIIWTAWLFPRRTLS